LREGWRELEKEYGEIGCGERERTMSEGGTKGEKRERG